MNPMTAGADEGDAERQPEGTEADQYVMSDQPWRWRLTEWDVAINDWGQRLMVYAAIIGQRWGWKTIFCIKINHYF